VHASFLDVFIQDHLMPFGDAFARNVLELANVIVSGHGKVSDIAMFNWHDIKPVTISGPDVP
jgi:hypothetical protein